MAPVRRTLRGVSRCSPRHNSTITPGNGSKNVGGMINTPAGPDCKFYGGNQVGDVIKSAAYGGADACPITIGQASRRKRVQHGQHHHQGLRPPHRHQYRLLQRRLRKRLEGKLLRQEDRLPTARRHTHRPGHHRQLAALRQRDHDRQGYVLVYIGNTRTRQLPSLLRRRKRPHHLPHTSQRTPTRRGTAYSGTTRPPTPAHSSTIAPPPIGLHHREIQRLGTRHRCRPLRHRQRIAEVDRRGEVPSRNSSTLSSILRRPSA